MLLSQLSGGLSGSSGLCWCGNPSTRSGEDHNQASLCPSMQSSSQGWTGMSQREVNAGLFIRPHYYVDVKVWHWCVLNLWHRRALWCSYVLLRLERVSRQRADQSKMEELRSFKAEYDSSVAEIKKVRKLSLTGHIEEPFCSVVFDVHTVFV